MSKAKLKELLPRIRSGRTVARDASVVYRLIQLLWELLAVKQAGPSKRVATGYSDDALSLCNEILSGAGLDLKPSEEKTPEDDLAALFADCFLRGLFGTEVIHLPPMVFPAPPIDNSNNGALKVGQIIPVKVFARSHRLHKTAECNLGVLGSWSVDGEGRVEAITELMKLIGVRSWCLDDREVRHVDQGVIEHLVTIHRLEDGNANPGQETPAQKEAKPQPLALRPGDEIEVKMSIVGYQGQMRTLASAQYELEFGGHKIPFKADGLAIALDRLMQKIGVSEFKPLFEQIRSLGSKSLPVLIIALKPQAPQS